MPRIVLEIVFQFNRLEGVLRRASEAPGSIYEGLLASLDVDWRCPAQDISRIPKRGPVIVIANHPFGLLESPLLGSLIERVQCDVRFLANSLLSELPELRSRVIP